MVIKLGSHLVGAEARKIWVFIFSYHKCFAFSLHDLEGFKGKSIHIQLEDDHPIVWRPYRLSVSERIDIQACCWELLAARLIELFNGEYACATVIPSKNDIFGHWTEKHMCRDYRPVNQKTKSDRYPMPTRVGCLMPLHFLESLAPWNWNPAITNSHYLREIDWKPYNGELIMMGRINSTIGSFWTVVAMGIALVPWQVQILP